MPVAIGKKNVILQSFEEEKNQLAIKLLSLKDKTLLLTFKVLFDDLTKPTKKISKTQYNKEIDAAVKRVRAGKSISNDEVMNEMDQW